VHTQLLGIAPVALGQGGLHYMRVIALASHFMISDFSPLPLETSQYGFGP
jgi:hypothetical protein